MSRQGYIQLTRQCNQNCRFCSNPPNDRNITLQKGRELIDRFLADGCDGVIFTGGEPTLSPVLPGLISYACEQGLANRVITNAQKICERDYFDELYDAGLRNINISLYSVRDAIESFLTDNPNALANIERAIENIGRRADNQLVINTVINKHNSDHLEENVRWVIDRAPFVRHFVWNNLDPRNSRVRAHPETVARLNDFQLSLHHAVKLVLDTGRTCRVERVPLCYMAGFEHLSTETRKIVKGDATTTFFLDDKGLFSQDEFFYGKASCCSACSLEAICAGLFEMDVYYFSEELYAVFVDRESIEQKIGAAETPAIPGARRKP